jgi:hypothetical protein
MKWAKPVYMYRFPNMTAPDGSLRTFDNNPAVMIPHEFDHGYDGELMDPNPIAYPEGFDDTVVSFFVRSKLHSILSLTGPVACPWPYHVHSEKCLTFSAQYRSLMRVVSNIFLQTRPSSIGRHRFVLISEPWL